MFKSKKTVFLIVLVCCLALTLLTGCSEESPADTVVCFFDSLNNYDLETAVSLFQGEEDFTIEPEEEELMKAIFGQITYDSLEIVSEQGDNAVVSVKITAPDLMDIFGTVIDDVTNAVMETEELDENIEQMVSEQLLEALTDPECPKVTNETEIKLEKVDDIWFILGDDELTAAITGNLSKVIAE